jgi:hypothetical protein
LQYLVALRKCGKPFSTNKEYALEWQELQNGLARRFALEDGAQIVGVIKAGDGEADIEFFANTADVASAESESEKLGGLSDYIDALQPQDVIEICARIDKSSKTI